MKIRWPELSGYMVCANDFNNIAISSPAIYEKVLQGTPVSRQCKATGANLAVLSLSR